jgi:hypothetical protein
MPLFTSIYNKKELLALATILYMYMLTSVSHFLVIALFLGKFCRVMLGRLMKTISSASLRSKAYQADDF